MKKLFILLFLFPAITFSQSINYELYKGKKVEGIASFQFENAIYYDYILNSKNLEDSSYVKIDEGKTPEGLLTQKFSSFFLVNTDVVLNKLVVFSKIDIAYNNVHYALIKYRLSAKDSLSKAQIFTVERVNNKWIENKLSNNILETSKFVMLLKNDSFLQFEYAENDDKFSEINKLKGSVKDLDGNVNIQKLGKLIKENAKALAKYCDFE